MTRYESWGRYPRIEQRGVELLARNDPLPTPGPDGASVLPYGNGRSYGDSCLNEGGVVLDCRPLDRIIEFDAEHGTLTCEAGMLFSDILEKIVPAGWFLPVTPGTRFVTVGGAIANDVHGKNHHRGGTFGCHVKRFELLRTDGTRILCSPTENADWYGATIGGLGLTGLITWAEVQLQAVAGPGIDREIIRYGSLAEFFRWSEDSDQGYEHTMAWLDCMARGRSLGRGLFIRGNHAPASSGKHPRPPRARLTFPIDLPFSIVNRASVKLLNAVYYRKQLRSRTRQIVHYEPFFYPLDGILRWNRAYGSKGFFQHHCVVPAHSGEAAFRKILDRIAFSGLGSTLAVLKVFGDVPSPGLLSFPRPGVNLALDFSNRPPTLGLLESLDEVVRSAGGSVYPAKDARMSAKSFQAFFPNWRELIPFLDPGMSSSFWRRVTAEV